jgi:hypothetical protein
MELSGQICSLGNSSSTPLGNCVGLRVCVDVAVKRRILVSAGIWTQVIRPVPSQYIDKAISAPRNNRFVSTIDKRQGQLEM